MASYTSYFPSLVSSLVLIGHSVIVREHHFTNHTRILYQAGIIPQALLDWAVNRRLKQAPATASAAKPKEPGVVVEAKLPEERRLIALFSWRGGQM